ncbi:MAG TPA: hypothetical protein VGN00_19085 [Puia sp.]|jgi:hypothetical protein
MMEHNDQKTPGTPIHTDLPAWIFLASGAGILSITIATVSYQALKAALMNPIKSLRTE